MTLDVLISCEDVEWDADALAIDAGLILRALRTDGELSVLLTTDDRIRTLNGQWRGKDVSTDVLSFPQDDGILLGDVVISIDTAARQASELGHDVGSEVRVLLTHGICHLLGHDHQDAEQTKLMRAAEQEGLAALGLSFRGLVSRADSQGPGV